MAANPTSLSFAEQIEFFRRKLNLTTEGWTDVYGPEHDWSFMVAGSNRDALVQDFRQAVEKAIVQGTTLEQFRQDFDQIVATHGWSYNGGRNWRSRLIYETNLRSSYMAGRYQQMQAVTQTRPFWKYVHSDAVEHPRPLHLAWNGLVLRHDDPWWNAHFPPNGWGCHCSVQALNQRDLQRMGKSGPDQAPAADLQTLTIGQRSPSGPRMVQVPAGIDPGFEYTPGKSRLEGAIPPPVGGSPSSGPANSSPMPDPSAFSADQLLSSGLGNEAYVQSFLDLLGATADQPAVIADPGGNRLVVGQSMFIGRQSGVLDATLAGSPEYLPLLAKTLQAPDEVWADLLYQADQSKAILRRRWLAQFWLQAEGQDDQLAAAVFEAGSDGWLGTVLIDPQAEQVQSLRVGEQLYQRETQ